jgi:Na+-driven multidrug efflux pump
LLGVLALVLVNVSIPEVVISIYTNNVDLINDAIPAFYVVSISAIFLTVGFVFFSGVSGTGMTRVSFAIETVVIGLYILITYLLVNMNNSKVEYVWTIEIIYGSLIGIISFMYLKYGKWQDRSI